MNLSHMALLGACAALSATLAGSAMAQPANDARVIQVPPGAVVLILGGTGGQAANGPVVTSTQSADAAPVLHLIAEQEAMMQRMMADMNALFPPMPDPSQLIQAALGGSGLPGFAPGFTTPSPAGGQGMAVCGESVTYTFNGNGSKPVVHVSRYGNACGGPAGGGSQNVTMPPQAVPIPAHQPKVLEVSYPARPMLPPHT